MMPLWYLHLTGFFAITTLLGCIVLFFKKTESSYLPAIISLTGLLAFISVDLFKALVINAPQGIFFSGIRVVDAMPIYVCLIALTVITLQTTRSRVKEKASYN
jgi:hypothetical protein